MSGPELDQRRIRGSQFCCGVDRETPSVLTEIIDLFPNPIKERVDVLDASAAVVQDGRHHGAMIHDVAVERHPVQRFFRPEGAIEARLAQSGALYDVADRGRGVALLPEEIQDGR